MLCTDKIATTDKVSIFFLNYFFSKGKIKGEIMYFMGKGLNICQSRVGFAAGCGEYVYVCFRLFLDSLLSKKASF